jgi:hypothetical protein
MRNNIARLSIETLEPRVNPSGWSFWEDTYVGAFLSGFCEGARNIATGAYDAVVELGRTGRDLVTIYSNWDDIDPSRLESKLFQSAAQTAGDPQAAAAFDNHLVFGIVTLGVGPLVESGVTASQSGDWTQFSQQAGGFGVMVLVPYGVGRGVGYLRGAGAASADTATTGRAGAVVVVEGEFNPLVRAVRYVEGPAPADAELAIVNQRLQLARQILTEEVQRLEAIDTAVITQAELDMLVNLRNASCAEAAVRLERAIATGEVHPIKSCSRITATQCTRFAVHRG